MHEETQKPGYDAQEPNNPDPGTAPPRGFKGFGRDVPGEELRGASIPTDRGASAFESAVSVGAEEAWNPFSPTELDPEVDPGLMIDRGDPFAPEGPSAASRRIYSHG